MRRQATRDEIELRLQTETRIPGEFRRTMRDMRIKMLFFRLIVQRYRALNALKIQNDRVTRQKKKKMKKRLSLCRTHSFHTFFQ